MSKTKCIKSVSFNINNEDEKACLEQIKEVNFSGYVKELIMSDLAKRNAERRIVHRSNGGGIKIVIGT